MAAIYNSIYNRTTTSRVGNQPPTVTTTFTLWNQASTVSLLTCKQETSLIPTCYGIRKAQFAKYVQIFSITYLHTLGNYFPSHATNSVKFQSV